MLTHMSISFLDIGIIFRSAPYLALSIPHVWNFLLCFEPFERGSLSFEGFEGFVISLCIFPMVLTGSMVLSSWY
jgi:hypothetical protein